MSIKLKVNGNKTTVETDSDDSANLHYLVRKHCPEVFGAMRSYGIKEMEMKITPIVLYDIKEKFNEEFKKKGYKEKYFHSV